MVAPAVASRISYSARTDFSQSEILDLAIYLKHRLCQSVIIVFS